MNGSASGDAFDVAPNAARMAVTRTNLVPFALDVAGIQQLTINSGAGADTIHVADMTGTDLQTVALNLGAGDAAQDVVTLDGRQVADDISVSPAAAGVGVDGLFARISITNSTAANDVLQVRGLGGDDRIEALTGTDSLIGLQLEGGAGNDTLIARDLLVGNATLVGNTGDDTLVGSAGNDVLLGGAGNDSISGGDGNDLLLGDAEGSGVGSSFAVVAIASGQGNDTLDGGAGNDTLNGDAGDDILLGPVTVAGVAFGDPGNDTMRGGNGDDTINGDSGNDQLYGDAGNDSILGGIGNDFVSGGAGNDSILGQAGDDTLNGDSGDDVILGADGNDQINGGDGNDQLWGDAGNDTMTGGSGNDAIVGGEGDDRIDGQDGNDVLFGNAGNDSIVGGFGDDSLYGGDGNDYLHGGTRIPSTPHVAPDPSLPNDGNDVILGGAGTDAVDGGNGNNTLDAGDDGIAETVLAGNGNDIGFGHRNHDSSRDIFGLDGGYNREYVQGGLTEPSLPDETGSPAVFVVTIQPPTGHFVVQPGDPTQYRTGPLPLSLRSRLEGGQMVVQQPTGPSNVHSGALHQRHATTVSPRAPHRFANGHGVVHGSNPFAGHTPAHAKFLTGHAARSRLSRP